MLIEESNRALTKSRKEQAIARQKQLEAEAESPSDPASDPAGDLTVIPS